MTPNLLKLQLVSVPSQVHGTLLVLSLLLCAEILQKLQTLVHLTSQHLPSAIDTFKIYRKEETFIARRHNFVHHRKHSGLLILHL
jgi:hypothetical protein